MKPIYKTLVMVAALGLPGFFPGTVQGISLPGITNVLKITAIALVQNENVVDNGTNTVTPAPLVKSVTTKDVLKRLALDKFAQGSYSFTNFPSGAKLIVFKQSGDFVFQVLGKTNDFIVDVSDILELDSGNKSVFSGRENDSSGLANPTTTDRSLMTLSFDDTSISGGGDVQFFLSGIIKSVTTDTKPNSITGLYTETQTHTTDKAIGEGSYQGSDLVISGSINVGGKGILQVF